MKTFRDDLVLPELSYQVVGACFEAFNDLGYGHREQAYQVGVREWLCERSIGFREQVRSGLFVNNKMVGSVVFDFVIEGEIVLELKVGERFRKADYQQIRQYLENQPCLKLGILARFGRSGVVIHRVLPSKFVDS